MPLPIVARPDFEIVDSKNLYLNATETAIVVALVRSVTPRTVLEIGCSIGLTARAILDRVPSVERYIAIDVPPDHEPALLCQRSEITRQPGIEAASDPRFFVLIREGGSCNVMIDDLEPCDAIFIDGDHSEHAVDSDSVLARALIRPRLSPGIIIWHDYGNPSVEVTQALDYLHDDLNWPIKHIENSWIAFRHV